jgi:proteasome lid subunit RPN8/RPN11
MNRKANLIFTGGQLEVVLNHVQACLPEEGCGLIAGRGRVIQRVFPIRNQARSTTEFVMDPEQQVETLLYLEDQGLELLAIFHSHPAGPSLPSPRDLADAAYPGVVHIILSPGEIGWITRGFLIIDGDFQEIEITVE